MLKQNSRFQQVFQQAPRKKIKLNVAEDQNYNQFKGEICEEQPLEIQENNRENRQPKTQLFNTLDEENSRNLSIYLLIKGATVKARKVQLPNQQNSKPQLKQQGKKSQKVIEVKQQFAEKGEAPINIQLKPKTAENIKSKAKVQKQVTGKSNWTNFLKESQKKVPKQKSISEFVAIDCQFVKSGDTQLLARLSIVEQEGNCLFDSYVRPKEQITDYLTDISGVTFTHIKNAPDKKTVVDQAKKTMYNKIVVGHTIDKDLQVCGLKHWKGYKALININEFSGFQEPNGKLISLKNLSLKFLGKNIQQGRHSSVEDAQATIQLFKLRRKEILKQFKVIA